MMEPGVAGAEVQGGDASRRAPRLRRLLAWLTDVMVMTAMSFVPFGLIGYVVPPDTTLVSVSLMLVGTTLGFAYFTLATPLFGNSLGKWLFGLRITSVDEKPVSWRCWITRGLVSGLWPINGAMVVVGRSGRHLGDRAARTVVVAIEPLRRLGPSVVSAAALSLCACAIAWLGINLAFLRSEVWRVVQEDIRRNAAGARVGAFPVGFEIANDDAVFDVEVGAGYRRVTLVRDGTAWTVTSNEPIDGQDVGFGSLSW